MTTPLSLKDAIRAAESALTELATARQAHPDREPAEALARLERAMAAIREASPDVAAPSAALAARLHDVQTRYTLQGRVLPAQILDGLFEAVQAGTAADRWGRAGMSGAFLDAPRTLGRWRALAGAACLLLAIGGGLLLQGRFSFDEEPRARPLEDPRNELLRPIGGRTSTATGALQPAGMAVPVGYGAPERPSGSGRTFMTFHLSGHGFVAGRITIDDVRVLDAAARQMRVLAPRRPVRVGDDHESN